LPGTSGRGETGPSEQREQREPRGPAHPVCGRAVWLRRFTTRSTDGAGRRQRGLAPAPGHARALGGWWGPSSPGLTPRQQDSAAALLPRVCDSLKFPPEALRLLRRGSASVSAQECGPVWLDAGQTEGKLCLRVLRAHV